MILMGTGFEKQKEITIIGHTTLRTPTTGDWGIRGPGGGKSQKSKLEAGRPTFCGKVCIRKGIIHDLKEGKKKATKGGERAS